MRKGRYFSLHYNVDGTPFTPVRGSADMHTPVPMGGDSSQAEIRHVAFSLVCHQVRASSELLLGIQSLVNAIYGNMDHSMQWRNLSFFLCCNSHHRKLPKRRAGIPQA